MEWKSSCFFSSLLYRKWRLTAETPIYASLFHLFCGFKIAQKQPCGSVLLNRYSSKFCKTSWKTHVPESIFNKVNLASLLKKRLKCRFFSEQFSIKHLWATGSDFWRLEKSSWLLVQCNISQTLWFLIFNDNILMLIFILFTKSEGIHKTSHSFLPFHQCVFHVSSLF